MEEFVKMIYNNWCCENEEEQGNLWGDCGETVEKLYDFLNEKIALELECEINKKIWRVQEKSFIAGFAYAAKCLSNGKVELKGGVVNE